MFSKCRDYARERWRYGRSINSGKKPKKGFVFSLSAVPCRSTHSFHVRFHYPYITPIYYIIVSMFFSIIPYVTPIYYIVVVSIFFPLSLR